MRIRLLPLFLLIFLPAAGCAVIMEPERLKEELDMSGAASSSTPATITAVRDMSFDEYWRCIVLQDHPEELPLLAQAIANGDMFRLKGGIKDPRYQIAQNVFNQYQFAEYELLFADGKKFSLRQWKNPMLQSGKRVIIKYRSGDDYLYPDMGNKSLCIVGE